MTRGIEAGPLPSSSLRRLVDFVERLMTRAPGTTLPRRSLDGVCSIASGEGQARASVVQDDVPRVEDGAVVEGAGASPTVVIEPWRVALMERQEEARRTCVRLRDSLQRFRQMPGHTQQQMEKVEAAYLAYMQNPGEFFDLGNIGLSFTPDELPPAKGINLSGNRLVALPANWPRTIRTVYANDNAFTSWPFPPDADLEWIIMKSCHLDEIPPLREGLLRLVVAGNRIARIPSQIPASLLRFDLGYNRLVDLPQAVLDSLRRIDYDFHGNPLSYEARCALTDAGFYSRSVLGRMLPQGSSAGHVPAAGGVDTAPLKYWYQPDAEDQFAAVEWEQWLRAPEARDFREMLSRLRTAMAEIEVLDQLQFRLDMREWLHALANPGNDTMRLLAFGMAKDALVSCEDRLMLAYGQMREAMVTHEVQAGRYDTNPTALVERARGIFRLAELDALAKTSVAGQANADPVEVFLAYRVFLRKRLELPLPEIGMRWPRLANLTEGDYDRAQTAVLQAEAQGFVDFLCRWQPWQAAVGRMMPDALVAEQERLLEVLPIQVEARLAAEQLEGHEAEVRMGKVVADELSDQLYRRLTLALFQQHAIAVVAPQ